MSSTEIDRKIAVILVADVVGYSKHMENDESATFKAYGQCETILNKLLKKYKGSIFNTAGDSVLAEFPSAVNAVECAVDFQNGLKKRNDNGKTEVKLEFRIGINMGDVVMKSGNLLGDGVNIAARLEALAQPNGISISKSVYDLVVPKTKVTFNDLGIQKVKQNTFHAYDILLDPSHKRKIKSQSSFNLPMVAGIAAAIVILLGGIFYFNQNNQSIKNKELVKSDISKVLIKPFKFLSKREDLSYVATGFTTHLGTSLSQHPQINVVPETTANFIDKNELTNTELKSKYSINYSVEATIQVSGDKIRLSSKITDLINEEVVASEVYQLTEDEIFEYQDKITDLALQKMSTIQHSINFKKRVSENPILILDQSYWVGRSYSNSEKSMRKAFRKLSLALKNDVRFEAVKRLINILRDDALDFHSIASSELNLHPEHNERIYLDLIQSLRISLMAHALLITAKLPTFSARDNLTPESLLLSALKMDLETVISQIKVAFPRIVVDRQFETYINSKDEYRKIQEDFINPLSICNELILETGVLISHAFNAHG